MKSTTSWIDLATVISAFASSLIALIAFLVALRAGTRSREVIKVQTFLALRADFFNIYKDLGDLSDPSPGDPDVELRRSLYWHQAFNEWYISNRLSPSEFGPLWTDFSSDALRSGLHPALVASFNRLADKPQIGFGLYAQDFISVVKATAEYQAADAALSAVAPGSA